MANNKKNSVKETQAEKNVIEQENAKAEKTYTESEVLLLIDKLKAEMRDEFAKAQPAVLQVAKEEYVSLLYVGAIAQGTIVNMGPLGRFTRAGAMIDVPKNTFLNGQTMLVSKLLENRHVIAVSGLSDDERARYGLDYKEGEVLTKRAFEKLLQFSEDDLASVFEILCDQHKGIVCRVFISEYFEKHNPNVTLGKVKRMNNATKHINPDGLLKPILEDMGAKISE